MELLQLCMIFKNKSIISNNYIAFFVFTFSNLSSLIRIRILNADSLPGGKKLMQIHLDPDTHL